MHTDGIGVVIGRLITVAIITAIYLAPVALLYHIYNRLGEIRDLLIQLREAKPR